MKINLKISLLSICTIFMQSCGVLSFSDYVELPGIHSFSVQDFTAGSADIDDDTRQRLASLLREYIARNTNLAQVNEYGDICYAGNIISLKSSTDDQPEYSYSNNSSNRNSSQETLTIVVEVSYTNNNSEAKSFQNKIFSAKSDILGGKDPKSKESIGQVLEKLVRDIYEQTLNTW